MYRFPSEPPQEKPNRRKIFLIFHRRSNFSKDEKQTGHQKIFSSLSFFTTLVEKRLLFTSKSAVSPSNAKWNAIAVEGSTKGPESGRVCGQYVSLQGVYLIFALCDSFKTSSPRHSFREKSIQVSRIDPLLSLIKPLLCRPAR